MACKTCGCEGHGTARRVECALCKREKWPVLIGDTPEGWTCATCRVEGAAVILARQERAQRATETRRQKQAES